MVLPADEGWGQTFAPAGPNRGPAVQSKCDIGAESCRQDIKLLSSEADSPECIAGNQGSSSIGRAAGHPTSQRDRLLHLKFNIERDIGVLGQRGCCAPDQIVL